MTPEPVATRMARYEERIAELEKANIKLANLLRHAEFARDLFQYNSAACSAEFEAKLKLQKREDLLVKLLKECVTWAAWDFSSADALRDRVVSALSLDPAIQRGGLVHHRNNPSHAMTLDGVNLNTFQAVCSWKKDDQVKQEWFAFHELEPHTPSPTDHNAPKS